MGKITTNFYRNKIKESTHNIICSIVSLNDEKLFSTNNDDDYIYPRSSIKIFQAIPFILSNAVDCFGLTQKQIALSCASHCSEYYHIKELEDWIKKLKIKKNALKCGSHYPLDKIA